MADITLRYGGDTFAAEETVVHIDITELPTWDEGNNVAAEYRVHAWSQTDWEALGDGDSVLPTLVSVKFGGPAFTWDNVLFPNDDDRDPATWIIMVYSETNGSYVGVSEDAKIGRAHV